MPLSLQRTSPQTTYPAVEVEDAAKDSYPTNSEPKENALAARDSLALKEADADYRDEEAEEEASYARRRSQSKAMRRRRRITQIALIAILLVVIGVSTALVTRAKNQQKNDADVPQENLAMSGNNPVITEVPTGSPSASPTLGSPVAILQDTAEYAILEPLVEDASLLLDATTPQGEAFMDILYEGITDSQKLVQRYALRVLYVSMGGRNWTWKSGWKNLEGPECSWYGIESCQYQAGDNDAAHKVVTTLDLLGNNMEGKIPPEICLLNELEYIRFENNVLGGEIPSCVKTLAYLKVLNVGSNQLIGGGPLGLFELPSIEEIDLSHNKFEGELDPLFDVSPDSNGPAYSTLKVLKFNNNHFRGNLPGKVYLITNIQTVTAHNNLLYGSISFICPRQIPFISADCDFGESIYCPCCCCTDSCLP